MKRNIWLASLVLCLVLPSGLEAASASDPTPTFTLSVTNITLPASGSGSIPITLSAVNGYTGTIVIACNPASPPSAGVLEPYCNPPHFGPALFVTLSASEPTATVSIPVTSLPEPAANSKLDRWPGNGAAVALAGVLMLGFGFRWRRARWPGLLLLGVGALIGFAGIGACAGGGSSGTQQTLTPGTYTYTVRAADQSIPQTAMNTTVKVTVPPGVPVQKQ